jgi:DNA polymerase III delta subunit
LAQVEALLGVRHGETPEDWCRAVLRGETGPAAAMLPHLVEQPGVNAVRLLMLLGTHLVGLALVRAHLERGARGRALEQAAFDTMRRIRLWGLNWRPTAALWAAAANDWPDRRLRSALRAARDADQVLKTTNISGETGVLTNLVLELARPAREAA